MTRPLDFGLCSADNLKIIYSPQDQPKGLVRGSVFLGCLVFLRAAFSQNGSPCLRLSAIVSGKVISSDGEPGEQVTGQVAGQVLRFCETPRKASEYPWPRAISESPWRRSKGFVSPGFDQAVGYYGDLGSFPAGRAVRFASFAQPDLPYGAEIVGISGLVADGFPHK